MTIRKYALAMMIGLLAVSITGCNTINAARSDRELSFRTSTGEQWRPLAFDQAFYAVHGKHHADVVLIQGDPAMPRYAMHMRIFFQPIGGLTPQNDQSTNAVVRILVNDGEEAAIFGGGGMLFNYTTWGKDDIRFGLRETAMRVLAASDGFARPNVPVAISGDFQAIRDDAKVSVILREMQSLVRQRLGYPRIVQLTPEANPSTDQS